MAQQPDPKPEPSMGQKLGGLYKFLGPFTLISSVGLNRGFGKNAIRQDFGWALLIQLMFMAAMPRAQEQLEGFLMIWIAVCLAQMVAANWNHHRGVRQDTRYVGWPRAKFFIPFVSEGTVRMLVNPLITYFIATMLPWPAVAMLLKASAFAQFLKGGIDRALESAAADARSDLELSMRQH